MKKTFTNLFYQWRSCGSASVIFKYHNPNLEMLSYIFFRAVFVVNWINEFSDKTAIVKLSMTGSFFFSAYVCGWTNS